MEKDGLDLSTLSQEELLSGSNKTIDETKEELIAVDDWGWIKELPNKTILSAVSYLKASMPYSLRAVVRNTFSFERGLVIMTNRTTPMSQEERFNQQKFAVFAKWYEAHKHNFAHEDDPMGRFH